MRETKQTEQSTQSRSIEPHDYRSDRVQLVTINGVTQVFLASNGKLMSVAVADGKQLWQHDWAANTIVQPAEIADGNVLLTSQESGIRRLALAQNSGAWTIEERWTSVPALYAKGVG